MTSRDRRFGLTSEQLAARIGAQVCAELGWPVDLDHPDVELTVEVDRREIFLRVERHRFQPGSRLYVAAVGRAQRALAVSGAGEAQIVAQRRLYLRLADALARRIGAQALVTGDSLGQVASQTLSNLAATEQAVGLPVLRPLLAFDKLEILQEARRIGTAEIATLPHQDCCRLFRPRRVATYTDPGRLAEIEARADLDELVDNVLSHVQEFDLDFCGDTAPTMATHDATTAVKDQ
jgi:thiamine biosynthesis protein ThiI